MAAQKQHQGELVLVTGGAGFIGSHVVDYLVSKGCRVLVIDDFSTGKRDNLAHWLDDPRVEIIQASIANGIFASLADVTRRQGPVDRIIHLAALVSVVYSIQNPLDDVRVNYAGTVHVMEYARHKHVKKVVFASSSAVYSNEAELPVHEGSECLPLSPYGIDKLASEKLLNCYAKVHGMNCASLRFFNVYGPRQDPSSPYSGVISIFADRARKAELLTVYGDGDQTRDFVYVGDVVRAVVSACLSETHSNAVANIGTGNATTINQLARQIIDLSGSSSSIQHLDPRSGEIRHSTAATELAERLFDFRAKICLREGLQQTLV